MLSKTHSKYIQSLHLKKCRDADGVFIAEGSKVVLELLQSQKFVCREVLALKDWLLLHEATVRHHYKGNLHMVEPHELDKITAMSTANQVLAVFNKAATEPVQPKASITLVLDRIQDPGNLGTIIRIADWFGVNGIVCSADSADMYNPKVVQSTMGSLGRVQVQYVELESWLAAQAPVPVFAAALQGKPLSSIDGLQEGIIVIGNESKGISDAVMAHCTGRITIAKKGMAESLNAAVAAGIILSHL